MRTPFCMAEVLRAFTHTLDLSWYPDEHHAFFEPLKPAHFHNWIDLLQPDQHHLIEVISHHNHHLLTDWLLANTPATTYILSDAIAVPEVLLRYGRNRAINVLRSPLPAEQIIHTLAFHLANSDSQHRQQHGVLVRLCGLGVLLQGKSGIGKSGIALELLEKQHQLVADDAPLLYRYPDTGYIYGICPPLLQGFLEVTDLGVLNVNKLFGPDATSTLTPLHLIIELIDDEHVIKLQQLSAIHHHANIMGVDIPVIKLFTKVQRNMATLVETAVKNHILYRDGYDANRVLTEKLQQKLKDTAE